MSPLRHCFALLAALGFCPAFAAEQATQTSTPGNGTAPPYVKYVYEPTTDPDLRKFQKLMREDKELERLVKSVEEIQPQLLHPFSLSVKVKECGGNASAYLHKTQEIHLCLESLAHSKEVYRSQGKSRHHLRQSVLAHIYFTFFHELGHALIDVFQIPIVGREEDAADEFSILSLLEEEKLGAEAALAAATFFRARELLKVRDGEVAWWDNHSFNLQRYYAMLCLVYGADPANHRKLVGKKRGRLPKERAEECVVDYQLKKERWETLLYVHVKKTENGAEHE